MDNNPSSLGGNVTPPVMPDAGKTVSTSEAAKILGIKPNDVQTLVKQELLKETAPGMFRAADLTGIVATKGLTLAQEAAQVGIGLQSAIASTLNVVGAIVTVAFAGAIMYGLAVAALAVAYAYRPAEVANWITQKNPSPIQALLQQPGTVALGILKYTQPSVYKTVAQNQVLNVNDYFTVSKYGTISPTEPVVFPAGSYFQTVSAVMVKNLNAQYLQGKIPGTATGNIAVIGAVTGLADNSVSTNDIQDNAVTSAKFATITDSNKVSGSAVQLNGNGGLTNNSGLSLLTTCSDSQILKWNGTDSAWECQADQGSAGSGITSIREGGVTTVASANAINFGASDFNVSESPASVGNITIDYTNSKIVRSNQNETISGTWTFPSGTVLGTDTFTSNAITDSGPLTIQTTTNGALTLDSGTVGAVNLGNGSSSKTITIGNTTGTTSLGLNSGSGGVSVTGATTFNSTPITLAAGSTVIDMTGSGTLSLNTVTNRAITTGTGLFTTGGALTADGALTSLTSLTASGNLATPKGTDFATTGTQNNVSLGNGSLFRFTGAADATFTGISGGTDGRLIRIANASTKNLTLNNLNGGSSASNQIVTSSGGDLVIGAGSTVNLAYDSTASLWRVVSFTPSSSTLSGIVFVNGGNGFGGTASLGTTDANILSLITSGASRFQLAAAAPTLTGQGSTSLTSTGTMDLSSAAASALNITSGTTGAVTINGGTTGAVNLGTNTSDSNITIGFNGAGPGIKNTILGGTFSTSTTTILSGTSGILIGDRAINKQINIGGNIFDAADTVRIATNGSSADTITIGNTNAATTLALTGGTSWSISSGGVLTLVGGQTPDITSNAGNSLTIDSGTTGAFNLGTGSSAKTISLGGSGANTVNIANSQTGGSLNLGAGMTTGTITIGGTGAQTGTIDIGTGTGTQTINFGTGAGIKTAVLGSSTTTSATNINSGTGNVNFTVGPASSSSNVVIGTSATATPDALVLDTGTADPTGGSATNGASYYNTSTNKFRCFEAGAWKDCDTTGGTTTLQSAYNAGQTITLSTGKPLSITGGDATDTVGITPSSAALTLTSGTTATWGTAAGNLTLQVAGSGTSANVQIGAGGAGSTTPDYLVVDKKSDPLAGGTNGAIVLDDNGKFNVFEAGAWKTLCNQTDQACGAGSGSALSAITAATTGNTINSGDNSQDWNWSLTTAAKTAMDFGENVASTNGAGAQYILGVSTLNTSTAKPFIATAQGTANGIEVDTTGKLSAIGTGAINATLLNNATFAAPGTIGGGTPGVATFTTLTANTSITDAGLTVNSGVYTDGSKVLTSTAPTSGVLGFWNRTGTTLSPSNSGDAVTTSGSISTSGTGTITSAGTLVASNGFTVTTGALAFNTTSGTLSATGLTALTETLSSGTAAITAPTLNLNTSSTGVVGIGNSTGAITFNSPTINLAGNSTIIDMTGTGTLGLNSTSNAPITTGTGLLTATGGLTTGATGNFSTLKGADFSTTGTTDNVSLGGGSGALFRYTGAGTATFSGIAGGANGRIIRIMNVSASNLTIKNNGSGTAANNVTTQTGSDIVLTQNETVTLQYDSVASVWRVMSLPTNATTLAGFAYVQGGNAFGVTANLGTTDANILNLITGGASRFQIAAAASTLTGQSSTTITSTADMTLSSAAANNLNVTSGTTGILTLDSGSSGNVNLGTGSTAKAIAIGGTGANTITIGNTQSAGSITLGNALVGGTITIGGTGQTGNMTLGSSSGTNNLFIANGAGATTLNLANVQTDGAVNIGAGMIGGSISIGGTGAQTGTLTFGGGTGAQIVNLATGGTGIKTVNLGTGSAANVISIGTTQTAGSIALGSAMTTGTIDIGNSSGAMTGTINIGGSTGAQNLNFGGGNTGIKTIAIGGGTAANVITIGNNQTGGSFAVGNAMTSGTITLGGTATTGQITIGQSQTGTNTISIGSGNLTAVTQTVNIGNGTSTTSGGEAINIGNGVPGTGTTNTISIGTQGGTTGTVGITIGSVGNAAHTTLIQGGSGNAITLTPQTTGKILIGATGGTGDITLGSSSGTNNVFIANGAGATTLNLANVQTAGAVNIGAGMTTGTITIGGTGLQTGTISIGTGTGAQSLNFGTGGTGAKTVTIGSTASTGSTSIASGTGGINIGTAAVAKAIHIGDGAAANTITLGSTNGASSLRLQVGSGTLTESGWTNQAGAGTDRVVCVVPGTGLVYFSNSASACTGSSLRYKHDITTLTPDKGLSSILGLRPVSFEYNGTSDPQLGFIAEETNPIYPELTYYDSTGKISGLNYEALTSPIVLSIQQLNNNLNGLAVNVNGSTNGLTALTGTVSSLQDQISSITAAYSAAITANNQSLLATVSTMINDIFTKTAQFFGKVIFNNDVAFVGRPTFNKDTAGFAMLSSGQNEVDVNFDKEYTTTPVVTASVNLVGGVNMSDVPSYAIYDLTTKGFKIKLSRNSGFDLQFSWIALAVANANTTQGTVSGAATTAPAATPVPTDTATPIASPTDTPTESPTIVPTPTGTPVPVATATP